MDELKFQAFEEGQEKLVSDMVWEVFLEFEAPDYSDEGVSIFKAFIDPQRLANEIKVSGYKIYCCFDGEILAGVIAFRNITHISLLFVRRSYHQRGIAKELLQLATREIIKEHSDVKELTVNSSPYAVDIYKQLEFIPTDKMQEKNGIIYMPMRKLLKTRITGKNEGFL